MEPYRYNPDFVDPTSTFVSTIPTQAPYQPASPHVARVIPQQHSERLSETSSNSETSFRSQNMNRGYGNQRGNGGGYRGGRGGHRAYSNSSGSSNGQYNPDRPTLKPSSAPPRAQQPPQVPQARIATPERPLQAPARVDSPLTPAKEQSSFTLNGNTINETYVPKPSTIAASPRPTPSPPRPSTQASPRYQNNRQHYSSGGQRPSPRPITRDIAPQWAYEQEGKVKLSNIPKGCWHKEVYQALSLYGNVTRVDMESNTHNAYVVFQPKPPNDIPYHNLRVGAASVRSETMQPRVIMVPSPVNPTRQYCEVTILPAQAIDFGVRVEDKSMIAMCTVQSHGIQVMLNLNRKELDIQFPLQIGGETRKYRFRLPFALLSHIYKVSDTTTGLPTLVIPFDSPPQFYIQKNEGEVMDDGREHTSFSRRERTWNDWDTWFRETDVISRVVRKSLQQVPLMNHMDTAIIDIGKF
jgi:RNA-dependent RNA polymerase